MPTSGTRSPATGCTGATCDCGGWAGTRRGHQAQLTGRQKALNQDPSKMFGRTHVKTLLANAGTARLFWLVDT
jgi:hypothetical protein